MIKKLFLFIVVLTFTSSIVQGETFEASDIFGTWYAYELDVHQTLGVYWLYADVEMSGPADVTGSITGPDGTTMLISSGTATVSEDGFLSGSFTTDTGLTGTIVNGLQDQKHSIFSYVSVDTENALGLAIGIKAGAQYQAADMAGDWRFYGIEVDPTLPGLYWLKGDGTIDGDGFINSATYSLPDGTTFNLADGQFFITSSGKVTGSLTFQGGLSTQITDGMFDCLKTFGAFVDVGNTGMMGLDLALKKGGNYLSSDLAGDWVFYNFTIDTVNELAYWVYGNGTIDSDGSLTGSYTGPDQSVYTISGGQVSLDTHGEISGSFTVTGVATETIQSGFMDQNKSIIVFVGTSDNGQLDLGIGMRTSEIPALYSYYLPYFRAHSNHWTGLGVKNLNRFEDANVKVRVFSQSGSVLVEEIFDVAAFGNDNFTIGSGESEEGWIQVDSNQPLAGLCFFATIGTPDYMADITFMDQISTTLHVPHVGQGPVYDTTLYVCNPNDTASTVNLRFISQDGDILYSVEKQISANGSWQYELSDLVPDSNHANYGSLEIVGTKSIGAFALYNNIKSGGASYAGISAEPEPQ